MALTFLTNLLYSVSLTTSFFTTLLSLLKSAGVFSNLSKSNLSTSLFKLLKPLGIIWNWLVSNSSTSYYKLTKSNFLANFNALAPAAFFKSAFVA